MADWWKIILVTLGLSLLSVIVWRWYHKVDEGNTRTIITDGGFEAGPYKCLSSWKDVEQVSINTWYLACDGDGGGGHYELTERDARVSVVELQNLGIGKRHGVMSVDTAGCDGMCSTSVVQLVPATAGKTYTLSVDGYSLTGDSGSLYLDFLTGQRSRISVETTGGFVQNDWRQVSVSGIAPEGTEYIRVILYTANKAVGTMVWDNVTLAGLN